MVLKGSSAELQAPGRSPGMIPGFFPLPLLNRGCSEAKNILGWWRGRNLAGLFQAPSNSLKQLLPHLELAVFVLTLRAWRLLERENSSEFLVSSEPVKFDSLHCFEFLAPVAMGFSLLPTVVGWVTLRRNAVFSFYFDVGTAFAPQAAGFGSSWSLSEGTSSLGAH